MRDIEGLEVQIVENGIFNIAVSFTEHGEHRACAGVGNTIKDAIQDLLSKLFVGDYVKVVGWEVSGSDTEVRMYCTGNVNRRPFSCSVTSNQYDPNTCMVYGFITATAACA